MVRSLVLSALLILACAPAHAQSPSHGHGRQVMWTVVGAGAGFGVGLWVGLTAFDDAVNSDRKVWTSAVVGAAVGGAAGYRIGRARRARARPSATRMESTDRPMDADGRTRVGPVRPVRPDSSGGRTECRSGLQHAAKGSAVMSVGSRMVDVVGGHLAVYDGSVSDHPVLLLHGGPGVPDYLELVRAGHIPWLQNPTAFSSEVRSFFTAAHPQAGACAVVGGL